MNQNELDTLTADACAAGLVSIARDAESTSINDAELVRRIDMLVDPYLNVPSLEDKDARRLQVVQALRGKCGGRGCERVAAHILRDD